MPLRRFKNTAASAAPIHLSTEKAMEQEIRQSINSVNPFFIFNQNHPEGLRWHVKGASADIMRKFTTWDEAKAYADRLQCDIASVA